jgi:hypothetical protein
LRVSRIEVSAAERRLMALVADRNTPAKVVWQADVILSPRLRRSTVVQAGRCASVPAA